MPKMKTHKGAKKRTKITGTGKIMRGRAFKSHKLTKKSAKRRRSLRQGGFISDADKRTVAKLLPYS
ncbi:50S ribosomal protein L35 [Anoxybacter fermentans]|uniref:Large ribosomal subunit protein bL35 n=1 Tax=Anoxybacter fermentans TaxID=1323375 RepID=A0A3Q9HSU1_9FIRM|nr:50S ribosomal protein L35 [Anoxybacter fermentans]AZR73675.1 50S ribosomal protein L35 [Anoxybacter fermentans]